MLPGIVDAGELAAHGGFIGRRIGHSGYPRLSAYGRLANAEHLRRGEE
jgi:hypothetical protein